MKFVYPEFLWALTALIFPVVIHLFHFRRYRKVIFPNVRFLLNIQKETQSVKKLRNFLVLLARMLAITCLVLAFAQPFIPTSNTQNQPTDVVSIYVDNSFSMESAGEAGPLIEEAKDKARNIVTAYPESARFQMLDNSGKRAGRSLNRDDAIGWIDELETSPVTQNYNDVIRFAKNGLERMGSGAGNLYLISDFQGTSNQPSLDLDSSYRITAIPLESASTRNLSIDTAWIDEPVIQRDQAFNVHVIVSNRGTDEVTESSVAIDIDGIRKSSAGFDLAPGEKSELVMGITLNQGGWRKANIHLEDEDLAFDNDYFLTFYLKDQIRILAVYDDAINPYLQSLYNTDKNYSFIPSAKGNIDLNELRRADLLIIDGVEDVSAGLIASIRQFAEEGGSVWIIPPDKMEQPSLNQLSAALNLPGYGAMLKGEYKVSSIQTGNPIFRSVFKKVPDNPDYPITHQHYALTNSSGEALMVLENRDPLLISQPVGKGYAFMLSTPLHTDWTTLPQHALFVPIGLRMSMLRSNDLPLSSTLGRSNLFKSVVESAAVQNQLKLKKDKLEWIPVVNPVGTSSYLDAGGTEVPAGNIEVWQSDSLIQIASFNYHRGESEAARLTTEELAVLLDGSRFTIANLSGDELHHSIITEREGIRYWKTCVILALIFLAIEILLLLLWPTTKRSSEKSIKDAPVAA
ncbi:MAG: BatA domain-containing protein [Flavobacteriales bacterium]|nr:BatA domain-containing protein [Flavobacteriales bacterium]